MSTPQSSRKSKVSGENFLLTFRPKGKVFQAAVVVTKKVAPRAVDRNRIKRLVFESLRKLDMIEGELVVVVKKNLAKLKTQEIQLKLKREISRLR